MTMNGGNRNNAHLLHKVKIYGSNEIVAEGKSELISSVSISESTLATIKRGMREVLTSSASTKKFFTDCPVEAILKTGTAQVGGTRSDNATMIGYGENEEKGGIAISVVIEQGMSGSNCGIVVNAIMKQYFGSK
jgi:cell division protein FtsI/penicillin-binding protein 2